MAKSALLSLVLQKQEEFSRYALLEVGGDADAGKRTYDGKPQAPQTRFALMLGVVYVCVCICVCMHACMYVYVYISVIHQLLLCKHVYMLYVCIYMCVYMCSLCIDTEFSTHTYILQCILSTGGFLCVPHAHARMLEWLRVHVILQSMHVFTYTLMCVFPWLVLTWFLHACKNHIYVRAYACVCICMICSDVFFACIQVCIYVRVYACVYICVTLSDVVFACMHVCTFCVSVVPFDVVRGSTKHACMYVYIRLCVCVCVFPWLVLTWFLHACMHVLWNAHVVLQSMHVCTCIFVCVCVFPWLVLTWFCMHACRSCGACTRTSFRTLQEII
jgi:hypothetical protein